MTNIASWIKQRLTALKNRRVGRFTKRISISVAVIIAALALTIWLRNFVGNSLFNDVPILLSGLIAYIFYLDQKKLEKIYEAKLSTYQEMLRELSVNYKLPLTILKAGIDIENNIGFSELSKDRSLAPSSSLLMTLLASREASIALSAINKKIQDVVFSMTLLIVKGKQGISKSDSFEIKIKYYLGLYLESLKSLRELHKLNIKLINEMRNDLELGVIEQQDVEKLTESFDATVNESFKFLTDMVDSLFSTALEKIKRSEGEKNETGITGEH